MVFSERAYDNYVNFSEVRQGASGVRRFSVEEGKAAVRDVGLKTWSVQGKYHADGQEAYRLSARGVPWHTDRFFLCFMGIRSMLRRYEGDSSGFAGLFTLKKRIRFHVE